MTSPINLSGLNTDDMDEAELLALASHARTVLRSRDEERIAAIPSMTDEAITALVKDHEDRFDECDDSGYMTDGSHYEPACPACVGRATLVKRKWARERLLPGADTSNSHMTRSAEDLILGDQVKHYPSPGSRHFYYVEAVIIHLITEGTMEVEWRKTNSDEKQFSGFYDRHESIDINRTYPRVSTLS